MLKNAKNIMYRLKYSRYRVLVYIGLKIVHIAKSSTCSVKKYKKHFFGPFLVIFAKNSAHHNFLENKNPVIK